MLLPLAETRGGTPAARRVAPCDRRHSPSRCLPDRARRRPGRTPRCVRRDRGARAGIRPAAAPPSPRQAPRACLHLCRTPTASSAARRSRRTRRRSAGCNPCTPTADRAAPRTRARAPRRRTGSRGSIRCRGCSSRAGDRSGALRPTPARRPRSVDRDRRHEARPKTSCP